MRTRVAGTIAARGQLASGLQRAGVEVLAQAGNFLLARAPVDDVFGQLATRRLVVRTFGHEPLLSDAFRITVQDPEANDRLLRALAELAGGAGAGPPAAAGRPSRDPPAGHEGDRDRASTWRSTAAAAAASGPASGSSTTCSRRWRSGECSTST